MIKIRSPVRDSSSVFWEFGENPSRDTSEQDLVLLHLIESRPAAITISKDGRFHDGRNWKGQKKRRKVANVVKIKRKSRKSK